MFLTPNFRQGLAFTGSLSLSVPRLSLWAGQDLLTVYRNVPIQPQPGNNGVVPGQER